YAEAVYNLELDEAALAEVYAGEALRGKVEEISERIADGRAAHAVVDHRYEVLILSEDSGHVVDQFVNHQVLIDPVTRSPLEPDPNEQVTFNFLMARTAEGWRVTFIERITL